MIPSLPMTEAKRGRPSKGEKQQITAKVDPDLHRRFKLHCVAEGLNMSDVVEKLVADYMAGVEPKKPRKQ
jgi:hypothetical protein